MNYPRILFILGLLVVLVPFLGIPLLWKHIVTVGLGITIIAFTILLRSSMRPPKAAKASHVNPVSNKQPPVSVSIDSVESSNEETA